MMKKTCDHCGLEEIVLISSMYWAKKEFRFVKCLACGHQDFYINTEDGKDLILIRKVKPKEVLCPKCGSDRTFIHSALFILGTGRSSSFRESMEIECAACGFKGDVEQDA